MATLTMTNCTTEIPPHSPVFVDTHFALAAFYFIFMVCTAVLLVIRRKRGHITAKWQSIFYALIIKGCLLRGLWSILQPFFLRCHLYLCLVASPLIANPAELWRQVLSLFSPPDFSASASVVLPNRVNFTLNILPSFVFFGNYVILLSLWAFTFHGSKLGTGVVSVSGPASAEPTRPYVHKSAWVIYISIVVVYLVLVTLDFALPSSSGQWCPVSTAINAVETGITLYDSIVYLIASVLFAFYGIGLQCRMNRNPGNSRRRKWVLFRINSLTALVVIAFTIRSTLVIVGNFYNLSGFSSGYVDILYYTCLEIVPLAFMLVVLISGTAPQTSKGYHSLNTKPQN